MANPSTPGGVYSPPFDLSYLAPLYTLIGFADVSAAALHRFNKKSFWCGVFETEDEWVEWVNRTLVVEWEGVRDILFGVEGKRSITTMSEHILTLGNEVKAALVRAGRGEDSKLVDAVVRWANDVHCWHLLWATPLPSHTSYLYLDFDALSDGTRRENGQSRDEWRKWQEDRRQAQLVLVDQYRRRWRPNLFERWVQIGQNPTDLWDRRRWLDEECGTHRPHITNEELQAWLTPPPLPVLKPRENELQPDTRVPAVQPEGQRVAAVVELLPSLLSAGDIAKRIRRNRSSVTSFLTRFADSNRNCRVEVENPQANSPRYLYRTGDVWPAIQSWLSAGATG